MRGPEGLPRGWLGWASVLTTGGGGGFRNMVHTRTRGSTRQEQGSATPFLPSQPSAVYTLFVKGQFCTKIYQVYNIPGTRLPSMRARLSRCHIRRRKKQNSKKQVVCSATQSRVAVQVMENLLEGVARVRSGNERLCDW